MNDLQRFFIVYPSALGRRSRPARIMRRAALIRAYGDAHVAHGLRYADGETEMLRAWNAQRLGDDLRHAPEDVKAYQFERRVLSHLKHPEWLEPHILPDPCA